MYLILIFNLDISHSTLRENTALHLKVDGMMLVVYTVDVYVVDMCV